jgi:hypothetical protein
MHHTGKEAYKRIIQMNRNSRVIKLRRGTYIVLHIEYPYFLSSSSYSIPRARKGNIFSIYISNKASLKSFWKKFKIKVHVINQETQSINRKKFSEFNMCSTKIKLYPMTIKNLKKKTSYLVVLTDILTFSLATLFQISKYMPSISLYL